MELFQNAHMTKLELLSNAQSIDSAIQFIKSKQSQQQDHHQQEDKQVDIIA